MNVKCKARIRALCTRDRPLTLLGKQISLKVASCGPLGRDANKVLLKGVLVALNISCHATQNSSPIIAQKVLFDDPFARSAKDQPKWICRKVILVNVWRCTS